MSTLRPALRSGSNGTIARVGALAVPVEAITGPVALFASADDEQVEAGTLRLATALMERGLELDLIVGSDRDRQAPRLPGGLDVIRLDADPRTAALAGLIRYLRLRRPRWLLASEHEAFLAVAARRLSGTEVRVVVRCPLLRSPTSASATPGRSRGAFARSLYRRVDAVVAGSPDRAIDLSTRCGLAVDDVAVIHEPLIGSAIETAAGKVTADPGAADPAAGVDRPVVLVAGPIARGQDLAMLEAGLRELRRRRRVAVAMFTDDAVRPPGDGLAAILAHPHVVVSTAPPRPPSALALEALSNGANVVVAGWLDLHGDGMQAAGLARSAPIEDPDAFASVLEGALDRPLRPRPAVVGRFVAAAAAESYLDLFGRLTGDRPAH